MSIGYLGEYFGACDVLTLGARLELAELLAVPGEPTALAGSEVGRLTMPETRELLDEVQVAISHGLTLSMMSTLADRRVVDVLPAISRVAVGPFGNAMPGRLRSALAFNGSDTWGSIAQVTLGDIGRLTNVGPKALVRLMQCGLAATFEGIDSVENALPRDDIEALLAYEVEVGSTALTDALDRLATGPGSAAIRAAASRLRAGTGVVRPLAALERALETAGDARDRVVFERLVLTIENAPTQASLGRSLGLSLQRVRDIRARALERVEDALRSHSPAIVHVVAKHLGFAAPAETVDRVLNEAGLPGSRDTRSLLVLWSAGPYRSIAGYPAWVCVDPRTLVAETNAALRADGGVRTLDHVRKDLVAVGLAEEHVDAWLQRQPVFFVEGLVVSDSGSRADVAERVLSATGRAMSIKELCEVGSQWPDHRGMLALLSDRRFVRVGIDSWELSEWGGIEFDDDPFGDDAALMLRVEVDDKLIAGNGGPVPVELALALGVGGDIVQARRPPGRPRKDGSVRSHAGGHTGGPSRTFASRFGPMMLSFDGVNASRASLRPIALAAGAIAGDVLVIRFSEPLTGGPADAISVEVIPASGTVHSLF